MGTSMVKSYRGGENMIKYILVLFLLAVITIGCATTTRPNASAVYKIPTISNQLPQISNIKELSKEELPKQIQYLFLKLYELDPAVAIEIGKLPEYQDNIGELQELSLRRFIDLLVKASHEEKNNIKELLNVGKPEFRRYCSPLQAIIWLLEKDEYDPMESPLKYPLDALLAKSWDFYDLKRWQNFDVVTDRLNAPFLVDYYERRQFVYEFSRKPGDLTASRYSLFKTKFGDCIDVTDFEVYCLRNGGYSAWVHNVGHIPGGYGSFHVVTVFEMEGGKYIMDNGLIMGRGIVPYDQYKPY